MESIGIQITCALIGAVANIVYPFKIEAVIDLQQAAQLDDVLAIGGL